MAEKKITSTTTKTVPNDTPETVRANNLWDQYSRPIIIVSSIIILAAAAWYAYKEFIKKPNERKANEMIFVAEGIFDKMASTTGFTKDSSIIVLNGSKELGITGVLKVNKEYGNTKAGNRAAFIAGATYLHLKEFDKAIKLLKDFDGNGAHQAQSKAYVMLGHAYAEQNKTGEALDYYEKAASVNKKDDGTTGDALFLAASYADAMGKKEKAVDLYKRLKTDYPAYATVKSGDVDKYLARLGILK
ncbi:MAG: tetratricopeptide repeat protein [Ferruginibacter sp.]